MKNKVLGKKLVPPHQASQPKWLTEDSLAGFAQKILEVEAIKTKHPVGVVDLESLGQGALKIKREEGEPSPVLKIKDGQQENLTNEKKDT